MAERYSKLYKTYIIAMVYAPLLPVSFVVGIFAVILHYWTDKYLILRRY